MNHSENVYQIFPTSAKYNEISGWIVFLKSNAKNAFHEGQLKPACTNSKYIPIEKPIKRDFHFG